VVEHRAGTEALVKAVTVPEYPGAIPLQKLAEAVIPVIARLLVPAAQAVQEVEVDRAL